MGHKVHPVGFRLGVIRSWQAKWYADKHYAEFLQEDLKLTDEAAQLQGGVGTAGSANIGTRWAMFEAIHGSAPRMVKEGRAQYADPSSMIRACAMLLRHIGYPQKAQDVEMALEVCGQFEKKVTITGRDTGATGGEYTKYILSWVDNPKLKSRWESEVFNVK